jgi:hypothetical protein
VGGKAPLGFQFLVCFRKDDCFENCSFVLKTGQQPEVGWASKFPVLILTFSNLCGNIQCIALCITCLLLETADVENQYSFNP